MKPVVFWTGEPPDGAGREGDRDPTRTAGPDPAEQLRHMLGVLAIVALACLLPRVLGASRGDSHALGPPVTIPAVEMRAVEGDRLYVRRQGASGEPAGAVYRLLPDGRYQPVRVRPVNAP